jgi:sulfate permease, SulP family
VVAATLLAARWSARLPGALIGLALSGLVVSLFGLEQQGVKVMGALVFAPPAPALAWPSWTEVTRLLPVSLTVALVCIMQTAAVAGSFPAQPDAPEELGRDFGAAGAGNVLAALIGAFAVDASPTSTAVVAASGGRPQLACLLALVLVAAIALAAGGAFAFVPQAAMGGVLVAIGLRLFRLRTMRQIYRRGGWEIVLVAASTALVVFLPIETGVGMSVVLSLMHSVYLVARPHCVELARVPGTTIWWPLSQDKAGEHEPGVLVFAPAAPINFINADYVRARLLSAIAGKAEPVRLVVIEGNGVAYIDYTGSQILQQTIRDLRRRHIDVALARLESERAQRAAEQSGLIDTLGPDRAFHSVEEAIQAREPRRRPRPRSIGSTVDAPRLWLLHGSLKAPIWTKRSRRQAASTRVRTTMRQP